MAAEALLVSLDGLLQGTDPGWASAMCGCLQGLTRGGYLLAADREGRQYELSPDGNR